MYCLSIFGEPRPKTETSAITPHNQSSAIATYGNMVQPRKPFTFNELDVRVEYAWSCLNYAKRLQREGADQKTVSEAYLTADKAQEGFHYSKRYLKAVPKLAQDVLKKDNIAVFDPTTCILTIAEKDLQKYQVGQKLPYGTEVYRRADEPLMYCSSDKKTNLINEVNRKDDIVYEDTEKNARITYKFEGKKHYFSPKPPFNNKMETTEIFKINVLPNEQMKRYVIDFYHNRGKFAKLFDVEVEHSAIAAIMKAHTNQLNVQIQERKVEDFQANTIFMKLLKQWQEKPLNTTIGKFSFSADNPEKNIYLFGITGVTNLSTGITNLNKEALANLGRCTKYNFLSNFYIKDIVIPGDIKSPYKTVTHYLIHKKIEKRREEANHQGGVMKTLKSLEKDLNKNGPQQSGVHAFLALRQHLIRPNEVHVESAYDTSSIHEPISKVVPPEKTYFPFWDLDHELKTALFYKFVDLDGRPNEQGSQLLDTGNVLLFAVQEIGDVDYGMRILRRDNRNIITIQGVNKLGQCLMELRDILREQELQQQQHLHVQEQQPHLHVVVDI